jgi:hypothetical protein
MCQKKHIVIFDLNVDFHRIVSQNGEEAICTLRKVPQTTPLPALVSRV